MINIDSLTKPSVQYTFRVSNIDMQEILSKPQPDSNLENILLQLKAQTVWIPHVPYPLKYGDVFTLKDEKAIEVYKNFINKKPKILEVVYN
jgi:hypothetical protein